MRLPFSDFKMVVMNHLKNPPSQLHLGARTFILMFQLCDRYKSLKPSFGIFFDISSMALTSLDGARIKDLSLFVPRYLGSVFLLLIGAFLKRFVLVKPCNER